MTDTHEVRTDRTAPDRPAAVPPVVDRESWSREREELLVREKAHTREGDAIAAARRRMSMTEVDTRTTLTGPDGPTPLLDLFEGREELIVYRHMWHEGAWRPGRTTPRAGRRATSRAGTGRPTRTAPGTAGRAAGPPRSGHGRA